MFGWEFGDTMGPTRMIGPDEVPGAGITIALFTDPQGHVIGLVKYLG